jgi:RHS repeat-associated protein
MGSVTAVASTAGAVVERYSYTAFGQSQVMTASFTNRSLSLYDWQTRFHGETRDDETGFYNYGYRYYNPVTGRWPSRDPIEEQGGLNLYAFVYNEPTSWIDDLGHRPSWVSGVINDILGEIAGIIGKTYNDGIEEQGEKLEQDAKDTEEEITDILEDIEDTLEKPDGSARSTRRRNRPLPRPSNSYTVKCYYQCDLIKATSEKCEYGNCKFDFATGVNNLSGISQDSSACPDLPDFSQKPYKDHMDCPTCDSWINAQKTIEVVK